MAHPVVKILSALVVAITLIKSVQSAPSPLPMNCVAVKSLADLTLNGKPAMLDVMPEHTLTFDLKKWSSGDDKAKVHTPTGHLAEGDGFTTVWPRGDGYIELKNIDNDSMYNWVFTIKGPHDDTLYVYLFGLDRCQLKYGEMSSLTMTPLIYKPAKP